jgi:sortase (surface protein transpeptidase)
MRKMLKICTLLAFLLALVAVVWTVRRWYRDRAENARQVAAVEVAVSTLGEKAWNHHRNLAKWYNYHLERGTPGLWSTYEDILDLGEGRMAVLEVPELGLKLPVSHGQGGIVGHDRDTALPIGGRGRHTVLFLRWGYNWEEGMQISVVCLGRRLTYRVESVQVMPQPWSLERPAGAGQDLLTLVYDRAGTRTLVRCVRCQTLAVREKQPLPAAGWTVAVLILGLMLSAGLRQWSSERKHLPENCRFMGRKRRNPELF